MVPTYNPIEHRLFPHVTHACEGVFFTSVELVKELMEKTNTSTGLTAFVHIIDKIYQTGRKVADDFKKICRLYLMTFCLNGIIGLFHDLFQMGKLFKFYSLIFIFDECHRSQFGETHKRIKLFFHNIQLFGFTGTPIFAENALKNDKGKRTTKELFGEALHKYVITDAIRDEKVLKFSVEYVGKYKKKKTATEIDIEVEAIDTEELMELPERLEKIVDYILANHNRKTHNREFTSIFAINSIDTLIKYYDILQRKKQAGQHSLTIATIFSYAPNDVDTNGFIPEEVSVVEETKALYGVQQDKREKLDEFINDYNKMFNTSSSTKDNQAFYNYYNDISKQVKEGKIDILLVVNMFLTGFDSKN
ncbi:DEAD/DEAH box helicase family protein [Candidatus Halobeggiatoa sp. HSG11]|nr:DEAD/DEAH box helicase family protein [Candidatus Halobeggiatoa sp. HSG11]